MPFVLIPFVCLFIVYITQENCHHFRAATVLKVSLTTLLSVWILLALLRGPSPVSLLGFLGMVFAVWGDYYLQYIKRDNGKFTRGVRAFSLTQLCYIAALCLAAGFRWTDGACFLIFAAVSAFFKLHFRWDTSQADPWLTVYTVLITCTGAKAASLLLTGGGGWTLYAGLGGVLFYLSDMVLGLWNYRREHILVADLNWLLYFSGQFLLAYGFVTC